MVFSELWAEFQVRDILDIAAVAVIAYVILKLIKGTQAIQIVYGLLALWFIYWIASLYDLQSLESLLRVALPYLGIAIIVIFQSEIRAALTHVGAYFPRPFGWRQARLGDDELIYEEVILAVTTLASERVGALIIFERDVSLENVMDTGVRLDARVSYDLLVTIFNTRAPLHDGAVIIRQGRLAAASCFLPLTLNPYLSKDLGTRHRAAIGITEETDAVAVVVSEETGIISLAIQGEIYRHLDAARLRAALHEALLPARRSRLMRAKAAPAALPQKKPQPVMSSPPPIEAVRGTLTARGAGSGEYQDG